jgi:micrococcal nuclease
MDTDPPLHHSSTAWGTTRRVASLVICLIAILLLVATANAATLRTLTAKVDRVSDGDTVTATDASGTKLRIRLLGIDAPEIAHGSKPGQPFGEEARQYLDSLVGGKIV